MDIIETVEKELMLVNRTIEFEVGDTVKVHYKIVEGNRERIQVYEGVVIAIDNKGIRKTFTVRRVSFDVGVERVFPFFSPRIDRIEVVRKGQIKRAKLYYLRERRGKSARLKEKRMKGTQKKSDQENIATDAASETNTQVDVAAATETTVVAETQEKKTEEMSE